MKQVVIVGAGVVGLFCAARLARMGARVTLLEAEAEDFTGRGPATSLAAAGMLAPISEMLVEGATHPHLNALALQSFDLWRAQSKEAAWADGVRFDGAGIVVRDETEREALIARVRDAGRRLEPLSAGQWRKRTGLSAKMDRALFVEDEAVADPERVLSGLVMDARRYGARVLFGQDVEKAAANSVSTWDGEAFEADVVLLTPGVWANAQLAAAAPALKVLRPAKGHLVPVALEQDLAATVHAPGFYLARRGPQGAVLGSNLEFDNETRHAEPARVNALLEAARAVFPDEITRAPGAKAWAGVRPMSPDWAPMIGWSGGLLVAAGHSRNGWLLAPVTAEIVCAQVLGHEVTPLWQAFTPDRFA